MHVQIACLLHTFSGLKIGVTSQNGSGSALSSIAREYGSFIIVNLFNYIEGIFDSPCGKAVYNIGHTYTGYYSTPMSRFSGYTLRVRSTSSVSLTNEWAYCNLFIHGSLRKNPV